MGSNEILPLPEYKKSLFNPLFNHLNEFPKDSNMAQPIHSMTHNNELKNEKIIELFRREIQKLFGINLG